jgi:hypothetical protein
MGEFDTSETMASTRLFMDEVISIDELLALLLSSGVICLEGV